jgi:hypothetical protein
VHAPAVAARATAGLALTGPRDHVQGAITPTVRRAWHLLPSGRLVLAVGDAWITNDPVTGQGANLGSHSAWEAADRIARRLAEGGPFDAAFGAGLDDAMWAYAEPVTCFTNAFLQPPPPHVMALTAAAAADQAVADRYVALFDDPPAMWRTVSSPAAAEAFVAAARAGAAVPASAH